MKLFSRSYGKGQALIILHGLLGSSENWRTVASGSLAQHFRVLALDLRNHGRSPHSDTFDYPSMAGDLEEFLEQEDVPSAFFLGHSMGGKTAMQFALTQPERVKKLIVVDVAPKEYPPRHVEVLDALRSLDLERYGSRREIDAALEEKIPSRAIRQFLLKNVRRENGRYRWQVNLGGIRENYGRVTLGFEQDDRVFDGPVLVIRGSNSDYVEDEDMELIRRLFPKTELVIIEGAGHWVHAEQPEAFEETVLKFLSSK